MLHLLVHSLNKTSANLTQCSYTRYDTHHLVQKPNQSPQQKSVEFFPLSRLPRPPWPTFTRLGAALPLRRLPDAEPPSVRRFRFVALSEPVPFSVAAGGAAVGPVGPRAPVAVDD